ncbi:hypothetical protein E2C01_016165 [Portunus trituberculatus]|uniref:Uncharacterized protein n=1 Tax=Portunus trituberculatus TaxID=210409 RepID=A0A5B7DQC7_PORTR|nr:hypothetical protein [Portunus trituberculatus]
MKDRRVEVLMAKVTAASCGFSEAVSQAEPRHRQYWVVAALRHNKRKQMTSVLQPPHDQQAGKGPVEPRPCSKNIRNLQTIPEAELEVCEGRDAKGEMGRGGLRTAPAAAAAAAAADPATTLLNHYAAMMPQCHVPVRSPANHYDLICPTHAPCYMSPSPNQCASGHLPLPIRRRTSARNLTCHVAVGFAARTYSLLEVKVGQPRFSARSVQLAPVRPRTPRRHQSGPWTPQSDEE